MSSNNVLVEVEDETFPVEELKNLAKLAFQYSQNSKASNTKKAYFLDWQDFEWWCHGKGLSPLPSSPQTVAVYLSDRASNEWVNKSGKKMPPLKTSTLMRRLATISQAHAIAGVHFDRNHSLISETWKGIKNTIGTAQTRKEPITTEDLREMVRSIPKENRLTSSRDRAILLLGFAGAFRRSELAKLNLEHLKFTQEGCIVTIIRSKTDQEGQGKEIGIPYGSNPSTCPVRALKEWITDAELINGALFRKIDRHENIGPTHLSDYSIALIIKRNEHIKERKHLFSGHSLRAGFATSAAARGVPEYEIMRQTRHRNADTLRKYIRMGNVWNENAATKVGL